MSKKKVLNQSHWGNPGWIPICMTNPESAHSFLLDPGFLLVQGPSGCPFLVFYPSALELSRNICPLAGGDPGGGDVAFLVNY